MSLPGKWVFDLARSSDMKGIGRFSNHRPPRLSYIYNKPGSLSITLPIDDDLALRVKKRSTCIIATRTSAEDVSKRVWSGGVTSIKDKADVENGTTEIVATGWMEEMDHRHVYVEDEPTARYVNQVGGQIAMNLLSIINSHEDSEGVDRSLHVTPGSATDTQIRTKTYKAGQNLGAAVREMMEIENGYDVWVDPSTRQLNTRAPTEFVDRTKVLFGYGIYPHNLEPPSREEDGTRTANRIIAVGSSGLTIAVDDPAAIGDADVMLEEWATLSDVPQASIIGAYANAELIFKRYGVTTYSIKPLAYGDVPRLFDDFELGDKVYLSVDRGRFQLRRQAVRIFTATIGFDAGGTEIFEDIGLAPA